MTDAQTGFETAFDDVKARRNAFVLAAAQAIGGAVAPINIAVSALAGSVLLGANQILATAPVTAFVVGTAAGAVPAALLMRRFGRRMGAIIGMFVGAAGGLLAADAMVVHLFPLLVAACFLMGFASAFVQQFRFAAADTASPAFRPKAISWVLAGGVVSAIVGPQAVIHFGDVFAPVPFAGAFVAAAGLSLTGALILVFLDAPRPTVSRDRTAGRPLGAIARQPRFILAVTCAVVTYALMNLVMTAAPLAMVHHGHHHSEAALGIQWHVLAMFAPSFFTGNLIGRFGADAIVGVGLLLLIACSLVALTGVDLMQFWSALVLLGVGWNLGFIGGTTMLAETYRPEEKERVQALNDLLVFGFVALASLASGGLLVGGGWSAVNMMVLPIAGACLLAVVLAAVRRRTAVAVDPRTP
ncbi:MFS transporter [Faunimonas sp. B44]|uniref:MFS transporter n=1 Tax=Faunimonas sp. B44 TaxID=3461493 RepID=UPI004044498D